MAHKVIMLRSYRIPVLLMLVSFQAWAQSLTGVVADAKTGETLPFSNIVVDNSENLISNAEGYFAIPQSRFGDQSTLIVSCMGYSSRKLTVGELRSIGMRVALEPAMIELNEVDVSGINQDPNQIMAQVRKNLPANYKTADRARNTVFMRESGTFKPSKFNLEIKKSTGFSKKSLASANGQLSHFSSSMMKEPPRTYTDMLFNYYSKGTNQTDKKQVPEVKMDMVKATRVVNEDRSASLEDLQTGAMKILLQHLDTLKFYRFKSGWFGTRDTISLNKEFQERGKKKKKRSELTSAKSKVSGFFTENNLMIGEKFEFINSPDIYEYSYEGATFTDGGDMAYIISFKPRKNKALYHGKLYVSESDFAVVRADYQLGKGKKVSGINLRLVLGVKAAEDVGSGTLIFRKKKSAEDYYLHYASVETGQYFYVNRPLKFIELAEEERDVVALELKVEGRMLTRKEFLNITREDISESDFDLAKEEDFGYVTLKKYDPSLWREYSSIEPLQEMKNYQAGL